MSRTLTIANLATTATNLAGGSGGTVPYQSSAGVTAMLANGTAGQVLTSSGTTVAPTWTTIATGSTPRDIYSSDLGVLARLSQTDVGGGTASVTNAGTLISSSATTTSSCMLKVSNYSSDNLFARNPKVTCTAKVDTAPTTGSSFFGIVDHSGLSDASWVSGSGHTYTRKHFGFKIVYTGSTAVISATNADGTTETETDITSGLTATTIYTYTAVYTTGTDIKYYVNGVLKATHTTNLPVSGGTGSPFSGTASVSNNTTATNFKIQVKTINYSQDTV